MQVVLLNWFFGNQRITCVLQLHKHEFLCWFKPSPAQCTKWIDDVDAIDNSDYGSEINDSCFLFNQQAIPPLHNYHLSNLFLTMIVTEKTMTKKIAIIMTMTSCIPRKRPHVIVIFAKYANKQNQSQVLYQKSCCKMFPLI